MHLSTHFPKTSFELHARHLAGGSLNALIAAARAISLAYFDYLDLCVWQAVCVSGSIPPCEEGWLRGAVRRALAILQGDAGREGAHRPFRLRELQRRLDPQREGWALMKFPLTEIALIAQEGRIRLLFRIASARTHSCFYLIMKQGWK